MIHVSAWEVSRVRGISAGYALVVSGLLRRESTRLNALNLQTCTPVHLFIA